MNKPLFVLLTLFLISPSRNSYTTEAPLQYFNVSEATKIILGSFQGQEITLGTPGFRIITAQESSDKTIEITVDLREEANFKKYCALIYRYYNPDAFALAGAGLIASVAAAHGYHGPEFDSSTAAVGIALIGCGLGLTLGTYKYCTTPSEVRKYWNAITDNGYFLRSATRLPRKYKSRHYVAFTIPATKEFLTNKKRGNILIQTSDSHE